MPTWQQSQLWQRYILLGSITLRQKKISIKIHTHKSFYSEKLIENKFSNESRADTREHHRVCQQPCYRSPPRDPDPSLVLLRVEEDVRVPLSHSLRKKRQRTRWRPSPSRRWRRRLRRRPSHSPRSSTSSPTYSPCTPLPPRLDECFVVWSDRLIVMFICSARPLRVPSVLRLLLDVPLRCSRNYL